LRASFIVLGTLAAQAAFADVSAEEAAKVAERHLQTEPGLRFECHLTELAGTTQGESEHHVFLCMPDPASSRRARPKLVFVHKETKEVSIAEAL
jgi:hypothetical protein